MGLFKSNEYIEFKYHLFQKYGYEWALNSEVWQIMKCFSFIGIKWLKSANILRSLNMFIQFRGLETWNNPCGSVIYFLSYLFMWGTLIHTVASVTFFEEDLVAIWHCLPGPL